MGGTPRRWLVVVSYKVALVLLLVKPVETESLHSRCTNTVDVMVVVVMVLDVGVVKFAGQALQERGHLSLILSTSVLSQSLWVPEGRVYIQTAGGWVGERKEMKGMYE